MTNVQSYNGGAILGISNSNESYFWDVVNSSRLSQNSPALTNLLRDVLTIGCAKLCSDAPEGCAPFALGSNAGACLAANNGAILLANNG